MAAKKTATTGKRSSSFTGKSKVISTGTLKGTIPRGGPSGIGQQTVKAAKKR
jgi:hypothetical protein